MARCPYLDYESTNYIFRSGDKYVCQLSGEKMDVDDSKVEYICNADYGCKYEDCPYYQSRG